MIGGRTRRLPLRAASVVALLVSLAISIGAVWAAHLAVRAQEHRLLHERSLEVSLVLTSAINAIPATLDEQGTVLRVTGGSRSAYAAAAAQAIKASPTPVSFAWLRPRAAGGGFEVLAAAGTATHEGEVIDDARVATLAKAMTTSKLESTPVIGRERLLGFAMGPPAAPAGTVLYREQMLGPAVSPPRAAGTRPFDELDVAIYATPTVNVGQVLTATTRHLPLHGEVRNDPLPAGAETWLLSVRARDPLVGSLTSKAPWFTLAVGVLGSLLIAAVVEISGRRRLAAVALYESEHQVAETLQRSLLPRLPELPGLDLAARYLASGEGQQVGGDWFDVFPISGERVGVVVGDVIGHDLTAASQMAQIRSALRAYAIDGDEPARVISRLDRLVDALQLTQLVTVFYGVLGAADGSGRRELRYSNAGHLPPVVRRADGRVESIADGESAVLGAPMTIEHTQGQRMLEAGDLLILFTDGLVELPGGSLDDGLARLHRAVGAKDALDAESMCDEVISGMSRQSLRDDIALLAVRLLAGSHVPAEAGTARA